MYRGNSQYIDSWGFCCLPIRVGTTDWPSTLGGRFFTPASSHAVGRKSAKYHGKFDRFPAAILPGHRAIIGTRRPPSYIVPLLPRYFPMLLKNSSVGPRTPPLSEVKKTMVF